MTTTEKNRKTKNTAEHLCKNCKHFDRYYVKAYCSFLREPYGFCDASHAPTGDGGRCDRWQRGTPRRRVFTKAMTLRALNDALTHIAQLAQIFCEENKDEP